MKKQITKIVLIILLVITLPFVISADLNGDGIDDGAQNLCGDLFCQSEENATSCPGDCVSPFVPPTNEPITTLPINEGANELDSNTSIDGENSSSKTYFFLSTSFKIILLVLVLIVVGFIVYFIIRKKKNSSISAAPIVTPSTP